MVTSVITIRRLFAKTLKGTPRYVHADHEGLSLMLHRVPDGYRGVFRYDLDVRSMSDILSTSSMLLDPHEVLHKINKYHSIGQF